MDTNYKECTLQNLPMIRYTSAPTKYDSAPHKTICSLHLNDDGSERRLFIQTSQDENNPCWESVENLVVRAFKPLFNNPCFLEDCLKKISQTESTAQDIKT